ncbi:MAG: TIR domain-containing protein, partial [Candidatus Thiodiazotropha sp.]
MTMQSLLVHLIFHPASDNARQLARTIHKALNADPVVPGLRIPTVFCPTDGVSPPLSYDLDNAESSFVVVLADEFVVDRDSEHERKWSTFIGDLWERCQDSAHRFLPVQLHEAAWGFDERLKGTSFLRAFAEPEREARDALIVRRLVIELCRQLQGSKEGVNNESKAPVKLFLSHTKLDIDVEPRVKNALTSYLTHDQPVRAWEDTGDIDAGSAFGEAIKQGIEESSLLCILTDNYASREWCRKEVILAKLNQRPMVVVEALHQREIRSFPYLGNVPVLNWPFIPSDKSEQERAAINRTAAEAAVDLLLKETLRHLHASAVLKRSAQEGDSITARPPELLTLLKAKGSKAILYPDPPLGNEELALLNDPDLPATTPLSRFAVDRSLKGRQIALSMSESTDIQRFGFDQIHLKEAITEISRYLLIKGATLVYGGHLGDESYTLALFDLVRAHHNVEGMEPMERIVNTVGWPLPFNQELKAKYSSVAWLNRIDRPADLTACPGSDTADQVEVNPFLPDQSAEYRYCWARGMTNMREAQVKKDSGIAARIILGGKFGPPEKGPGADEKWYAGRMPGVLEEVVFSAQAGQPVLLIGAFGGAAALVIDLLEGKERVEASWAYQRRAPYAEEMRDLYKRYGQPWLDYPEIVDILRAVGVAGI